MNARSVSNNLPSPSIVTPLEQPYTLLDSQRFGFQTNAAAPKTQLPTPKKSPLARISRHQKPQLETKQTIHTPAHPRHNLSLI